MTFHLRIGLDAIGSYRRLSYTPWHALAEFVDNSTQSYLNHKDKLDKLYVEAGDRLEVSVVYDPGHDLIRISDNASGMNEEELERALHVAQRPLNPTWRSRYGMGMKTAACWLGDFWTVRTKKYGDNHEYTVEVDVPRIMKGDGDLQTKVREVADKASHYTVIEVGKLHRVLKGRTLGKIRDYLRSMYRQDFRDGKLKLLWRGDELTWEELDAKLLKAPDGSVYKKDLRFEVNGKPAVGWVGVLRDGSRADAGFSILHCGRVVRGWPDAWRPGSLYGQIQGSNDLINQRLVGEINLDAFDVSHTKDDILWLADEEQIVEEELEKACRDYRSVAKQFRKGADQRGPSAIETEAAVQELKKELQSPEIIDTIRLEVAPPPAVVTETYHALINAEKRREETFHVAVSGITLKGYLTADRSINDPYFVADATRDDEVCVVINQSHPHWAQLVGAEGVLNYLRHCVYDALAEHMARHKKATIEPDTIKMFKDRFLRVPVHLEMGQAETEGEEETPLPT